MTAIALNAAFVLAVVTALSLSGRFLGPRPKHQGDAEEPYETGMRPIEPAIGKMSVLYYRFAVLFVVFDVDLAFFLPWALNRGSLTPEIMVSGTLFTVLVGFMLAYFWRKEALTC